MSITIAANIASLQAQRRLTQAADKVATSLERLGSGSRINHASDDAAGLAIASSLRADSRIASVAINNANYGVSAISIADSGLQAVSNILTRMAELAEQAANGVYSTAQRSPIQAEFVALASEIERIAVTTKLNSISLLSGGANVVIQVGFDSFSTSQISIAGVQGTLQGLSLAAAGSSTLIYSINGATNVDAQTAAKTALAGVQAALQNVSQKRGLLGAAESRLNVAVNNLLVSRENLVSAESRIRDVDVASETANLLRHRILQQTATAILAQANQQPQLALKLLQG